MAISTLGFNAYGTCLAFPKLSGASGFKVNFVLIPLSEFPNPPLTQLNVWLKHSLDSPVLWTLPLLWFLISSRSNLISFSQFQQTVQLQHLSLHIVSELSIDFGISPRVG